MTGCALYDVAVYADLTLALVQKHTETCTPHFDLVNNPCFIVIATAEFNLARILLTMHCDKQILTLRVKPTPDPEP